MEDNNNNNYELFWSIMSEIEEEEANFELNALYEEEIINNMQLI